MGCGNKKKNMTPNTDATYNKTPNADADYDASPDLIILYYLLKYRIDPKAMLNLQFFNDSNWWQYCHQKMPPPTVSTPPPTHPTLLLTYTLPPPLRKIRHMWDNYLMVSNILLLKVILLRRDLVAKMSLIDAWPTSISFPNLWSVLGIPVSWLNFSLDYRFYKWITAKFWNQRNLLLT